MFRIESADIQSFAQGAIETLLSRMEAGKSAEKVAENDYLMKGDDDCAEDL